MLTNFASTELWNTYILQMSHAEAAIQHIILAVGHLLSTQARTFDQTMIPEEPNQQMIYHHYGKALQYLTKSPDPDVNIVLLACLIFCLFEELQGNCYPAIQHIVAGRDIISKHIHKRKSPTRSDNLAAIKASSGWNPLLAQLLQVYKGLETHVAVLESRALNPIARIPLSGFTEQEVESYRESRKRLCWEPYQDPSFSVDDINSTLPEFANMDDASRYLAGLAAICVATEANSSHNTQHIWHTTFLVSSRLALLLNHWLEAFNRMMSTYSAKTFTINDRVNCHILRLYQSCLAFMNQAKDMGQETIFDNNRVVFDSIMFRKSILISMTQEELIPLLFFVATRCRVGYLRRMAVDDLRRCGLEGELLADIAEKVIDVEKSSHLEQEDGNEEATFGFPAEASRIRLHGMSPPISQDRDIFHLMVSNFPYYPLVPQWPLPVRLPFVLENEFLDKAGPCLDRALRFEPYSRLLDY
ncbi:uncharacterized protein BHQ10_003278 [Talaromyces amestolkiae]|uniref:Transcription factor domain-containing protein n=1 Tax=Talaromyces amestolkiae TaxID=1196081 RepID=A0A364KUN7_TALAM|nr:uncharacterized protein BHQ10_003278 [Talaromyces amestolkiae]RAO67266.1 hypothetical protein BHQ10_003278 [Talaromyces amestolkiae]